MKYSDKAYRELYSLAGLLEKFNNEFKKTEAAPWSQDKKDKIAGDIEEWTYMLKSYSKKIEGLNFVEDFKELPTKECEMRASEYAEGGLPQSLKDIPDEVFE